VCGPIGDLQGIQTAACVLDQLPRHLGVGGHALLPEAYEARAVGRAPVVDLEGKVKDQEKNGQTNGIHKELWEVGCNNGLQPFSYDFLRESEVKLLYM
jgi:hypothetical protein